MVLVAHGATYTYELFPHYRQFMRRSKRSNCNHLLETMEKTNAFITVYGSLRHEIMRRHPRMIGT